MTSHKVLLAILLLSKIGTGMVSLFVLARCLGPADYGFVATIFCL
jgi:O-antigen/teichoic acid export membrane protein